MNECFLGHASYNLYMLTKTYSLQVLKCMIFKQMFSLHIDKH